MEHIGSDSPSAYLDAAFAELRSAVRDLDDDHIMRIIDHVRSEAGEGAAHRLISELMRAAHNALTEPTAAACITTALARYGPDRREV